MTKNLNHLDLAANLDEILGKGTINLDTYTSNIKSRKINTVNNGWDKKKETSIIINIFI